MEVTFLTSALTLADKIYFEKDLFSVVSCRFVSLLYAMLVEGRNLYRE
jgi:hypothetical protein